MACGCWKEQFIVRNLVGYLKEEERNNPKHVTSENMDDL